MTSIDGIILGAVQGLTEFIPVSSSGHVILMEYLLSGASSHLFVEWINVGTVLALLVFFRRRIWSILQDIVVKKDYRLARNIVVACLPAGVLGFVLSNFISEATFFTSVWTVVGALVVLGVVMIVIEKLPRLSEVSSLGKLSWRRALAIGCAQVLALVPGTSRSGSTIVAGRLLGLDRARAAEFSFLISIPIMLGVLLKLVVKASDRAYFVDNAVLLVVANIVAFAAGLAAVGFLMKFLERHQLAVFGWYRLALALVIATVLLVQ